MIVLVPMSEPEYLRFIAATVPAYAADKVAAGQWPPGESLELARKALQELLPQGLATQDNYLFTIRKAAESVAVGRLWFAAQQRADKRIAYVYDVNIAPEHQRKGYASRAFLALESVARNLGLAGVALHVFGHNVAAQAMYAKLGYLPTNINLYKPVGPAGA